MADTVEVLRKSYPYYDYAQHIAKRVGLTNKMGVLTLASEIAMLIEEEREACAILAETCEADAAAMAIRHSPAYDPYRPEKAAAE
ncbi:MAG: hypothetical protein Q7T86_03060 [Hyphomicrobiaceae bacterium]|nr:hypothetical protein [Hyphomicrobiaceae bacterium]